MEINDLVCLNEKSAPALTAAGAAFSQTQQKERGGRLTTLSAMLVGPRKAGRDAELSGGIPRTSITAELDAIVAEGKILGGDALRCNIADSIVMTFEALDILEGRGERTLFVWMYLHLLPMAPEVMLAAVRHVPHYGSWRTLGLLYEQASEDAGTASADGKALLSRLRNLIAALWSRQLLVDERRLNRAESARAAAKETAAIPAGKRLAVETAGASPTPVPVASEDAAVACVADADEAPKPAGTVSAKLSLAAKWAPRVGSAFDTSCCLALHLVYEMDRLRRASESTVRKLRGELAKADGLEMEVDTEEDPLGMRSLSDTLEADSVDKTDAPDGHAPFLPTLAYAAAEKKAQIDRSKAQNAAEMRYRKVLARLSTYLDVVEQKMAAQQWQTIDPTHVPSLANKKYLAALKNTLPSVKHARDEKKDAGRRAGVDTTAAPGANMRSTDPDRVLCAAHVVESAVASIKAAKEGKMGKTIKGARNQVHELVNIYLSRDMGADPVVEAMWLDLVSQMRAKATFKPGVPLVDVSGSMAGLPMQVSIAMGILMSTLQPKESPWYGKMITFESVPQWHDISGCESLYEAVTSVRDMSWGGSTDFGAAMQLLLTTCRTLKLTAAEVPAQMFVFTDMNFDAAGSANNAFAIRNSRQMSAPAVASPFTCAGRDVRLAFEDEGLQMPQLILWNLRADGPPSFQAETSMPGVALMSGFSQECLRQFCDAGDLPVAPAASVVDAADPSAALKAAAALQATAWQVLAAKLNSERYARLRDDIMRLAEGPLAGYTWTPPPAPEAASEDGSEAPSAPVRSARYGKRSRAVASGFGRGRGRRHR